jgi:N-acetylneuraminic acid mutarotase
VAEGNLYLISGFRPPHERIEPSTWRYNPAADMWTELAQMPVPVTHAGVGVAGTEAWVVGGFLGNNPGPATTRVQIYETLTDHWRDGPPLPGHSASAAAAMLGSRLHVIGGLDLDRKTDVLDHLVLDTADPHAQWSRLAPLPAPGRNHHSAVGLNGAVYVVGGHSGHDGPLVDLKLAHAYEPQSDSWRRIAHLPEERHHCEASTVVWNDRIVVGGGLGRGRVAALPDLVAYDPNQDAWESIGLLPIPLWGTVVQLVGDELIVTTGSTHTNKGASGDTWSYPLGESGAG